MGKAASKADLSDTSVVTSYFPVEKQVQSTRPVEINALIFIIAMCVLQMAFLKMRNAFRNSHKFGLIYFSTIFIDFGKDPIRIATFCQILQFFFPIFCSTGYGSIRH